MEVPLRKLRTRYFDLVFATALVREFEEDHFGRSFSCVRSYTARVTHTMVPGTKQVWFARCQQIDGKQVISPRERYWGITLEPGVHEVTATVKSPNSDRMPHVFGSAWLGHDGTLWVPWVLFENDRFCTVTAESITLRVSYERATWDERIRGKSS